MSAETYRKIKAVLLITMLAGAKAHDLKQNSRFSSTGMHFRTREQATDIGEQVGGMTADSNSREEAKSVAELEGALKIGSNIQEHTIYVAKQIKAMEANPQKRIAEQIHAKIANSRRYLEAIMSDAALPERAKVVAKQMETMMVSPNIQRRAKLIAVQVERVMANSNSPRIHVKRITDELVDMLINQGLSEWPLTSAEQVRANENTYEDRANHRVQAHHMDTRAALGSVTANNKATARNQDTYVNSLLDILFDRALKVSWKEKDGTKNLTVPAKIQPVRKGLEAVRSWAIAVDIKLELLCGTTVAMAMIPEAVAFSFVAGVPPACGLLTAWTIGIVTALAGGRPAMISGATGALAVVVGSMVQSKGIEYLFYSVILMGFWQILLGLLNAGALVRMIPVSAMMGFCNGLALVISAAQFGSFKLPGSSGAHDDHGLFPIAASMSVFTDGKPWVSGVELAFSVMLTVISFLVSQLMPKLTKKVPSALTSIALCTGLEWGILRGVLRRHTRLIRDVSSVHSKFPSLIWFDHRYVVPPFNMQTFWTILPLSLIMCVIGLLESLMTLNLIDEITRTKGNTNRECIGQGLANIVCGSFGGMGGNAMIGQAMINVRSGGRSRLSSTWAGVLLAIFLFAAYPAIDIIPISALAGVMFNVCYGTFEWRSLKIMAIAAMPASLRSKLLGRNTKESQIRRADAFVILLVTVLTVLYDLGIAVIVGAIFSSCMFALDCSTAINIAATSNLQINDATDVESGQNKTVKVYEIRGILFFGSTTKFLSLFDVENDPDEVELVFENNFGTDFSGVQALNTLGERYSRVGKRMTLSRLTEDSRKLVTKASALLTESQEEGGMEVTTVQEAHGVEEAPGPRYRHSIESGHGTGARRKATKPVRLRHSLEVTSVQQAHGVQEEVGRRFRHSVELGQGAKNGLIDDAIKRRAMRRSAEILGESTTDPPKKTWRRRKA